MADESTTTLKDTITQGTGSGTTTTTTGGGAGGADDKGTTTTTTTAATTSVVDAAADKDALEVGRILLGSGFSKDQINDLMAAPNALARIQHLVREDPQQFIQNLEQVDPAIAGKFLEQVSDIYLKRNEHLINKDDKGAGGAGGAGGDKKGQVPEEVKTLMDQVADLRGKLNNYEDRETKREQTAAVAQVKSRYDARVDDMFNSDGIKALNLTRSEQRAMRARLDAELGSDQSAVQRISKGNFVDVPQKFRSIMEEWSGDRKAAADAEKAAREKVQNSSVAEFPNASEAWMVDNKTLESASESWDATEEAFAKALARTAK